MITKSRITLSLSKGELVEEQQGYHDRHGGLSVTLVCHR
jgi:hypothetical protein